jgi:hypothetical protein
VAAGFIADRGLEYATGVDFTTAKWKFQVQPRGLAANRDLFNWLMTVRSKSLAKSERLSNAEWERYGKSTAGRWLFEQAWQSDSGAEMAIWGIPTFACGGGTGLLFAVLIKTSGCRADLTDKKRSTASKTGICKEPDSASGFCCSAILTITTVKYCKICWPCGGMHSSMIWKKNKKGRRVLPQPAGVGAPKSTGFCTILSSAQTAKAVAAGRCVGLVGKCNCRDSLYAADAKRHFCCRHCGDGWTLPLAFQLKA